MKRARPCDACGAPRLRWQRLCDPCYRALPAALAGELINAWKTRRKADWRALRKQARDWIAASKARTVSSPQDTFERTERLLGERD